MKTSPMAHDNKTHVFFNGAQLIVSLGISVKTNMNATHENLNRKFAIIFFSEGDNIHLFSKEKYV